MEIQLSEYIFEPLPMHY